MRRTARAVVLGVVTAAATGAVILAALGSAGGAAMVRADLVVPIDLPNIELVDTHGRPANIADGGGKVRLIFFGYTSCPDVCPLVLAQLARLYENLGEPEDLEVVMVTVDPGRDTPERLGAFLARFHRSFIGYTGSHEAIVRTMEAFDAIARVAEPYVLHTDAVTVVGPMGRVRAIYGQSRRTEGASFDPATFARLRADVTALRRLAVR